MNSETKIAVLEQILPTLTEDELRMVFEELDEETFERIGGVFDDMCVGVKEEEKNIEIDFSDPNNIVIKISLRELIDMLRPPKTNPAPYTPCPITPDPWYISKYSKYRWEDDDTVTDTGIRITCDSSGGFVITSETEIKTDTNADD